MYKDHDSDDEQDLDVKGLRHVQLFWAFVTTLAFQIGVTVCVFLAWLIVPESACTQPLFWMMSAEFALHGMYVCLHLHRLVTEAPESARGRAFYNGLAALNCMLLFYGLRMVSQEGGCTDSVTFTCAKWMCMGLGLSFPLCAIHLKRVRYS
jgi:hypothetical protein